MPVFPQIPEPDKSPKGFIVVRNKEGTDLPNGECVSMLDNTAEITGKDVEQSDATNAGRCVGILANNRQMGTSGIVHGIAKDNYGLAQCYGWVYAKKVTTASVAVVSHVLEAGLAGQLTPVTRALASAAFNIDSVVAVPLKDALLADTHCHAFVKRMGIVA